MRSKPPKQIEQKIDTNDEDENIIEVQDGGPSISSNKKNTIMVIGVAIGLVIFCYFVFFSGVDNSAEKLEPVPQVTAQDTNKAKGENVLSEEEDKSIFDLKQIDKKEKEESLTLLDKKFKPEIPELPELPAEMGGGDLIDIKKLTNNSDEANKNNDDKSKIISENQQELKAQEALQIKERDQKIQELETKLEEQKKTLEKERQIMLEAAKNSAEAAKNNAQQNNEQNKIDDKIDNDKNKAEVEDKKIAQEKLAKEEAETKVVESSFDPRYSPIVIFSDRQDASPNLGVGQEKNIVVLKEDEFKKIKRTDTSIDVEMVGDRSHTIAQGKMLNAILETSINTEFPGAVRGLITRDVYGESGKEVLIPKGSRLYGSYSSEIRRGQARVNISWSRVLRPDGVSISVAFSAADQFGRAGIPGEVDNKYSAMIANSLLTSVLAVAGVAATQQVIGGNTQSSTTINQTQGTTTTYGNASNQILYDVTKTIVDIVSGVLKNTIDLNPIIRVPQGSRITVIVNSDIVVPSMRRTRMR